jgi:hypothetical protein
MRHSSTLWAAVGALSLVAAQEAPQITAAMGWDEMPQLDERGIDKRQCCCQNTQTVTETVTNCYIP